MTARCDYTSVVLVHTRYDIPAIPKCPATCEVIVTWPTFSLVNPGRGAGDECRLGARRRCVDRPLRVSSRSSGQAAYHDHLRTWIRSARSTFWLSSPATHAMGGLHMAGLVPPCLRTAAAAWDSSCRYRPYGADGRSPADSVGSL